MKKLYRSSTDVVVSGILGGLGEYFNIDPVVLRLGFIFLVLVTGLFPGVVGYIIALLIVPKHHQSSTPSSHKDEKIHEQPQSDEEKSEEPKASESIV